MKYFNGHTFYMMLNLMIMYVFLLRNYEHYFLIFLAILNYYIININSIRINIYQNNVLNSIKRMINILIFNINIIIFDLSIIT